MQQRGPAGGVEGVDLFRKGHSAVKELKEDDPEGVDVDFRVVGLVAKDLGELRLRREKGMRRRERGRGAGRE